MPPEAVVGDTALVSWGSGMDTSQFLDRCVICLRNQRKTWIMNILSIFCNVQVQFDLKNPSLRSGHRPVLCPAASVDILATLGDNRWEKLNRTEKFQFKRSLRPDFCSRMKQCLWYCNPKYPIENERETEDTNFTFSGDILTQCDSVCWRRMSMCAGWPIEKQLTRRSSVSSEAQAAP